MRLVEVFAHTLFQYRWSKRSKRLTFFDSIVENLFHLAATRIDNNRSIAKRAWPKLHSALKPANNQTSSNILCRAPCQLFVRVRLESQCAFFQRRADLIV